MQRFEDIEEWHWRDYVSVTGLRVGPSDVRDLCVAVEKLPDVARHAWRSEQALANARTVNDGGQRKAERAMQRGANTVIGKILNGHDARFSSALIWWLSQAHTFAAE